MVEKVVGFKLCLEYIICGIYTVPPYRGIVVCESFIDTLLLWLIIMFVYFIIGLWTELIILRAQMSLHCNVVLCTLFTVYNVHSRVSVPLEKVDDTLFIFYLPYIYTQKSNRFSQFMFPSFFFYILFRSKIISQSQRLIILFFF